MTYYNNSYIDHQNGYYSWYLYAPLTPAILAEISKRVCPGDQGADHRHRPAAITCISRCAITAATIKTWWTLTNWALADQHSTRGSLILLLLEDAPPPPPVGY